MLGQLGFESDSAQRMSDASKLLKKGRYDCILVDKKSSVKWKKNLSNLASHSSHPLVFLTGGEKLEFDSGSLLETADGYFQVSPASVSEFGTHIRNSVDNKSAHEANLDRFPQIQTDSIGTGFHNETQCIIRTRKIVSDEAHEDISIVAQREDGTYGILFGDFTGSEMLRSLHIARIQPRIQSSILECDTPAQILQSLNRDLLSACSSVDFMGAVSAFVDLNKNRFVYSIAGHMPILYRQWGSRRWQCLSGREIPLGIRGNLSCGNEVLRTKSGDRILLLSDGILKPHSINRRWLEVDYMLEDLDMLPIDIAPHEILECLDEMANPERGSGLSDEFTAMLIQF